MGMQNKTGPAIWLVGLSLGGLATAVEAQTALSPVVISGQSATPAGDAVRLRGEALDAQRAGAQSNTLAAVLEGQSGVAQSWFGPQANRPILRGQEGDRVRLIDDGAAVLDASGLSADHAVPIDALALDQVELIRGPQALRWGGSPLAGLVQSRSARLPLEVPDGLSGRVGLRLATPDAPHQAAGAIDFGREDWAAHLDGQRHDGGDYASPKGRVRNSAAWSESGGVGAVWNTEALGGMRLGFSADTLNSRYGVIADPTVSIHLLRQHQRAVVMSANGAVDRPDQPDWQLQLDHSNYHHEEIDGSGAVGTAFTHDGGSLRFETRHRPAEGVEGQLGLEHERADFAALGAEAYVPGTRTARTALFAVESGRLSASGWGRPDWSAALRSEHRQLDGLGEAWGSASRFGVAHSEQHVATQLALEAGLQQRDQRLALRLSRLERLPSVAELHADGIHVATASYERGDPNLSTELGRAIELLAQSTEAGASGAGWQLSLWQADYGRYLVQRATGRDVLVTDAQGLTVPWAEYATTAVAARLTGLEAQGRWSWRGSAADSSRWTLESRLNGLAGRDLDRAEPLPRLAPWQLRSVLGQQSGPWRTTLIWTLTARQTQVPTDDVPTAGWGRVDLRLQRRIGLESDRLTATLALDNAGNVTAANASSMRTLRDIALLPARTLSASLRWNF